MRRGNFTLGTTRKRSASTARLSTPEGIEERRQRLMKMVIPTSEFFAHHYRLQGEPDADEDSSSGGGESGYSINSPKYPACPPNTPVHQPKASVCGCPLCTAPEPQPEVQHIEDVDKEEEETDDAASAGSSTCGDEDCRCCHPSDEFSLPPSEDEAEEPAAEAEDAEATAA